MVPVARLVAHTALRIRRLPVRVAVGLVLMSERPQKRHRGGREPVDARQKLLGLLDQWIKDLWPTCVAADQLGDEQLRQQGCAWLLTQVEKWEVDPTPSRNHKLKVCGSRIGSWFWWLPMASLYTG